MSKIPDPFKALVDNVPDPPDCWFAHLKDAGKASITAIDLLRDTANSRTYYDSSEEPTNTTVVNLDSSHASANKDFRSNHPSVQSKVGRPRGSKWDPLLAKIDNAKKSYCVDQLDDEQIEAIRRSWNQGNPDKKIRDLSHAKKVIRDTRRRK
jgi:hypothetical protein